MKNTNQIIGAYEACSILNIPLSTLYYLSSTGKIRAIKVGKRWRYNREDIEHYNNFGTKKVEIIKGNRRERRDYPRINCHIPCDFKIDLPNKQNQVGTIQNISASGLSINIPQGYENNIDDPIEIEFMLKNLYSEDSLDRVKVYGRLVRKEDNRIAVKHRNIPEEIKERIIRFVG